MRSIKFVVILMAMAIVGCVTLATPVPTPISTPIHLPTETPIPPAATFDPTPTPDPLLFRDGFEGSLEEGWQWVRENNKYWSLTNNAGWLEIMARAGSVGGGNIDNLFLRQAPEGNLELETKLRFKPAGRVPA